MADSSISEEATSSTSNSVQITRVVRGLSEVDTDFVAVEEPLEIRVEGRSVAITMRTPGHDRELAAGFLLGEGVIEGPDEIFEIAQCPALDRDGSQSGNGADVLLTKGATVEFEKLTRHVYSTSSCGICGKASMDAVFQDFSAVEVDWKVAESLVKSLPDRLRTAQPTFAQTGGLHASALFDRTGNLMVVREDVGRHNALDKVLGHALLSGWLPLSDHILLLSGRVSFELMQKALAGGISLVAAISAPSSLAVEFARRSRQTVAGFVRGERMNLYSRPERILVGE